MSPPPELCHPQGHSPLHQVDQHPHLGKIQFKLELSVLRSTSTSLSPLSLPPPQ